MNPSIKIPTDMVDNILPDPALSIPDFLWFELPIITMTKGSYKLNDFLSPLPPTTVDPTIIRKIPTPPIATVKALAAACLAGGGEGMSILCPHVASSSARHLPMWVVTYWSEDVNLRTKFCAPWVRAEKKLNAKQQVWSKKQPEETYSLVNEVLDALGTLSWSGTIHGFGDEEPMFKLATYATQDWLSTVHENQMLDLLR
ncbi:hypothetical protein JAAARDRAFT_199506 [Jaapia argillacea MUCL 33604]|uniref:Uncharacterized protein n=1 Tax=Jaapia argillacea MUCL 33604 TaxID=933084 RepID=A0A067PKK5_9AGAM|nr:hypothetical protein JAAARDRAFT_199506 [Jaapia argillacea MUCL 33604]